MKVCAKCRRTQYCSKECQPLISVPPYPVSSPLPLPFVLALLFGNAVGQLEHWNAGCHKKECKALGKTAAEEQKAEE